MCGRYTLRTNMRKVAERFRLSANDLPDIRPRINIAPTQEVLTIRQVGAERQPAIMRWGLVPSFMSHAKRAHP